MGITLYHYPRSGPSRFALLVARLLGLDVDIQVVDLSKKEQFNPDFVKINPQHCVPTLVDGDFVLWESKAIAAYLVRKYGKDDSFYPTEPKAKAIVDQRLYFDTGVLYASLRRICYPVIYLEEDLVYDEHKTALDEALGFLDVFLDEKNFACGDKLTIADCALASTVSSIAAVGFDIKPFGNVDVWLAKCALEIPDFEESNQKGANAYGKLVRSKVAPGQI